MDLAGRCNKIQLRRRFKPSRQSTAFKQRICFSWTVPMFRYVFNETLFLIDSEYVTRGQGENVKATTPLADVDRVDVHVGACLSHYSLLISVVFPDFIHRKIESSCFVYSPLLANLCKDMSWDIFFQRHTMVTADMLYLCTLQQHLFKATGTHST